MEPARAAGQELLPPRGPSRAVAAAGANRRDASVTPSPARQGASHRAGEPEVLVPAGEQQALLQFVALVHAQQASPAALLAAGQPSPDLPEPSDIRIEPLEIAPLDPAEAQGTD